MLKNGYSNGRTNRVSAILRHRPTRHLAAWLMAFTLVGAMWYYLADWPHGGGKVPTQQSVIIHKTSAEIDVMSWPEERWFEGPRNETELERAALVMLVRYSYPLFHRTN